MSWNRLAVAGTLIIVAAACTADTDAANDTETGDTTAAAPAAPGESETGPTAVAELRDSSGAVVGRATLRDPATGSVEVVVNVTGLEPGEHGVHIHATGQCEPSGESPFESAGGHVNPDSAEHGLENPNGPHAGDLPNMTVDDSGSGELTATTDRLTLGEGEGSLFDADGAAFVVHADPDDQMSDPAGNAGARVACGVFERS